MRSSVHWATMLAGLLLTVMVTACGGPRFVNHPPSDVPPLPADLALLVEAQCPPDEAGRRACDPASPLGAPVESGGMGCDAAALPGDQMGGLDPAYPLAICELHPALHGDEMQAIMEALEASGDYVLRGGGLWPVFKRYVIQHDGVLTLLGNHARFQAAYAPVDTPAEALSYALAVTGNEARYGLKRERGLAYSVDVLEDTHVVETDEGYTVLLYAYEVFGCGPHWTNAIELVVERDGSWREARTWPVFRDPDEDNLCVD